MTARIVNFNITREVARAVPATAGDGWVADFRLCGLADGLGFTRASTASCTDGTGSLQVVGTDAPRFDYGGGMPRGLLVEGARTNFLLNSNTPATQTRSLGTGTYTLWVRGGGSCTVTAGTAAGSGFGNASAGVPVVFTLAGAGTCVFTVSGSLSLFQCELGTMASSFIPTAGSAATRAQDNVLAASLNSLAYNPAQGTWVIEFEPGYGLNAPVYSDLLDISDNTNGNRMTLYKPINVSTLRFEVVRGGAAQTSFMAAGNLNHGGGNRAAFAYAANDFAAVLNGGTVASAASGLLPATVTRMVVGNRFSGVNPMFSWVRRVSYYPIRINNYDLQGLTR